jgi:5-methyltetrahydropteroyltriglutamate--homocysteine methyltransferase
MIESMPGGQPLLCRVLRGEATMPRKPPFRAEHVGSLLRPRALYDARAAFDGDLRRTVRSGEGRSSATLRPIEDAAILEAVALQERVGLYSITDGEYRRRSWYQDFVLGLENTTIRFEVGPLSFADNHGNRAPTPRICVEGKLRRPGPIMVDAYAFLRKATTRTPKVTMPAPSELHFFGGRDVIDRSVYPDLEEFWSDLVGIYRAEIADLAAAGCTYFQFDNCSFPLLCDPKFQAAFQGAGEDPRALIDRYIGAINAVLAERPAGITFAIHLCRGNNRGQWLGTGGYDYIADMVFERVNFDAFFLEYDTPRAGDFGPLRHVPNGKDVVLGLVSSKTPELESAESVKRRLSDAEKYLSLDHVCLSPQCGFGSNFLGNPLTIADEEAKLRRVVEVAKSVWS